jgi:hypothetical protein
VVAGVLLGATAAWCCATNAPQPGPHETLPASGPSPEARSPPDRRNVEKSPAIAAASNQARSCLDLERRPSQALTGEPLLDLTRNIINSCFARQGSSAQAEQVDALPLVYARHASTGTPVELAYKCGCVVPRSCAVYARFAGVREDQCCGHGGVPVYNGDLDATYGGCVPPELASVEQQVEACPARGAALPARSYAADAYRGGD